jgi:hypothetical protein
MKAKRGTSTRPTYNNRMHFRFYMALTFSKLEHHLDQA